MQKEAMSGKKSTSDEAGVVEITVIRSGDAKRSKISISLSSTLNALRDAISNDDIFGPIQRSEQRLFYLGRELKSGNRTLSAMGIGNHDIFVLHLHSLAPKLIDLQCDEKDDDIGQKKRSGEVARRGKSDGNRNADSGSEMAGTRRARRQQRKEKDNVVELLDSDSEDGEDDAVEIIDTAPKRRRRG